MYVAHIVLLSAIISISKVNGKGSDYSAVQSESASVLRRSHPPTHTECDKGPHDIGILIRTLMVVMMMMMMMMMMTQSTFTAMMMMMMMTTTMMMAMIMITQSTSTA